MQKDDVRSLMETLIFFNRDSEAVKLQNALNDYINLVKTSLKTIWPPGVVYQHVR